MKKVNLKLLMVIVIAIMATGVGVVLLRRFQVSRNAGSLAKLARQRLDEGKPAEALAIYSRYLGLRPNDHEAFSEYARLLLGRASAPDATRADIARAYNGLEEAVRRNPESDDLRKDLAEFQLRIGRPGDAREHLGVLRDRLASGQLQQKPTPPGDDGEPQEGRAKPIDETTIDLLSARSYLASGDAQEAGRLSAAMVGYDLPARRFDPDKTLAGVTDAYIILAAVLETRLNDQQAASAVLERLVETHADDVQAWLALSGWHRQHGDLDGAVTAIDKAMEIAPENGDAIFAAFELALVRNDLDDAESLARRGLELLPMDERPYRALAAVAMQRRDPATAEQLLLDGIESLPNRASLLLMLADALLQQNKLEQVGQTIARLQEIYGPGSPAVGLLEGRLLVSQRRWKDAKAKLEQVRPLVLGATDLVRQIDLYLGQCHAQLDEFDAQLDVNRRVLNEDPSSLAARAGTAAALASAGKSTEALAEFETIAAGLPADRLAATPQVWYPLLQLRVQQQAKLPAADRDWSRVDDLLESLQQAPDVSGAQMTLLRSDVLLRKGEAEAARELLERGAADGEDAQVWSALVMLALRQEGPDAAAKILARAPATIRDVPAMLNAACQVTSRMDEKSRAAAWEALESRAAALPDDQAADVLATMAGVRLATGDTAAAARLWRDVAKRRPDDIRCREAILELTMIDDDLDASREAAAEVARVSGPSTARAKVANAGVRIQEVRQAVRQRQEAGEGSDLTDAEREALDGARNLLIEAENERPGWSQIQTLFADVDALKGEMPSAITRLQKAVALGPANPAIVRRLVAMLYSVNRLEEARQVMSGLGSDGRDGIDRISAEMELRAGRLEQACLIAERAVSRDSGNPDDLLWLGQVLSRANRADQAGEVLVRATELAPDRADTWLALFAHQAALGNKPAAGRTLARAAGLLPEPQRQLTLAQGHEVLGRLDEAERSLREAADVSPGSLDVSRALAAFLVRRGRLGPARETLQSIIDSDIKSATAEEAKAWARRQLAELMAERGTFAELEQAIAILRGTGPEKTDIATEDAMLQVKLLANRPEPASWRRAIELLEELQRRQELPTGQRIALAQLYEKVGRWNECRNELVTSVASPTAPPAYVALLIEKMIDHGEVSAVRPWLVRLQKAAPESAITLALEAKLAIAENDRKAAAVAARKLMPGDLVAGDQPGQLSAVAQLMEQLGFPKAADRVLQQFADASSEGVLARAAFLGRQKRIDDAVALLADRWDDLPLERLMSTAVEIVRSQDEPASAAPRIAPWFAKAKRVDPGSVVLQLLEAELYALEGKPEEAERIYRSIIDRKDLEPTQRAVVSNNLAFHLAKPDTAAEAGRLIDAAVAHLGPLPDLLDTRGMVRLAQGDNTAAVDDLAEAVLQPSDVKFLHLAWAQFRSGDEAAARKSLEAGRRKGLALSRLSPDDRQRLGELEKALDSPAAPPAAEQDDQPQPPA
jgi:tetratricopeptide (TPR) repeat protein